MSSNQPPRQGPTAITYAFIAAAIAVVIIAAVQLIGDVVMTSNSAAQHQTDNP